MAKKKQDEAGPSRREFVKVALTGAVATAAFGSGYFWMRPRREAGLEAGAVSDALDAPAFIDTRLNPSLHYPIVPLGSDVHAQDFTGDEPMRPHGIFWRKEAYLKERGGIPKATETHPVVIIGGGMAGLAAAFSLRDEQPLLLEQASRLGGNSKGEEWAGTPFSIGAAYITVPDPGSPSEQLLSELGILSEAREENAEKEAVVLKGSKLFHGFWQGSTDPDRKADFVRVSNLLKEVREKAYPDIPYDADGALSKARHDELDRISFKQWAMTNLGPMHPHIGEFLREYCWSSFGGGYDELSAAQALNFLTGDLGGILVYPGGNARIAQRLTERLVETLPETNIRTHSTAVDVRLNEDGVQVCYENARGELRTVQTQAVIFASGKFIAKHVVQDVPAEQRAAIDKLRYRAYTVANLLVSKKMESPCYELFHLTEKLDSFEGKDLSEMEAAKTVPFTDVIFGNWAAHDQGERSVLTLYRAYPYEGGRPELYAQGSYERAKADFERAIPAALQSLGIEQEQVESMRISRWGHALPLAAQGLLADGVCERASAPIGDRIFFAHQDNWANPCFETAIGTAAEAATHVRTVLTSLSVKAEQ